MPNGTLSALAAATVAASAALASGAGFNNGVYGDGLINLTQKEAAAHAAKIFTRADLNADGGLSADEFTALSIVTAELAYLNGFIVIEGAGAPRIIALPIEAPAALSLGERARVEAVARNTFYARAGGDGVLTEVEFVKAQMVKFGDSDRNRNGALAKSELANFALKQAQFAVGV